MPLPAANTPWPPKEWQPIFNDMRRWDAWWTGDATGLHAVYSNPNTGTTTSRGVVGMLQRWFWGRNRTPERPSRHDLHIPAGGDLCQTSANLLYANPPTLDTGDDHQPATVEALDTYVDAGMWDTMITAAETGAALGGRYQRVTWDLDVSPHPFLTTVDADHALPEFRWGNLVAVTFWTVIRQTDTTVLRHVERHELVDGYGVTVHGLYDGTPTNLGRRIDITGHVATAGLKDSINAEGAVVDAVTPGLNVAYIPNITPARRWRDKPVGKELGRSDMDGIEPVMDALDEVWNSWMRDLRLGKARVLASRDMLETSPGTPATFDLDQEIFTPLDGVLPARDTNGLPIQQMQFNIRVQEHAATARALVDQLRHDAGYSTSTFGDHGQDADITATEVRAREKRTLTTRDRKIRLERPRLAALLRKLLLVDNALTGVDIGDPDRVRVVYPHGVQDDIESLGRTVAMLNSAEAASTQTKVTLLHDDWDQTQIDEEVDRIRQERNGGVIDPETWKPSLTGPPNA